MRFVKYASRFESVFRSLTDFSVAYPSLIAHSEVTVNTNEARFGYPEYWVIVVRYDLTVSAETLTVCTFGAELT